MAAILGLPNTETFSSERHTNVRREVFYNYPNGAAPLTGLLSLMESQESNDVQFKWWEKRFEEQWTTITNISTTVVFYKTVTGLASTTYASGTGTWTVADGDISFAVDGTVYGLKLAAGGAEKFRPGHTFELVTGDSKTIQGCVATNGVDGANDRIAFTVLKAVASVDHDNASNDGLRVDILGSAHHQGSRDRSVGRYNKPVQLYNYCTIHKTPFRIPGTLLNTSVDFDNSGVYQDMAKEHAVKHSVEMERAFLFQQRGYDTDTEDEPIYYGGGVLFFLEQWELTSNNPYGVSGASSDSDDGKRIIENTDGIISETDLDEYYERAFRVTNNSANEKLGLCGGGALMVLNQLYRSKSMFTTDIPMTDTYGMDVVKHRTPNGLVYYKTHPLMTQHPALRYNLLLLDVPNLVYRHVIGRDTELLTDRQENDADYRKDEWITESGLEVRYPESCMYIKKIQDFS